MAEEPVTVSQLFIRIARGRAELEEWMATLTPAQWVTSHKDGWSIKDHFIHLAMWEKGTAALLRGQSRYAAMGIQLNNPVPDDVDAVNTRIYTQNKDHSLNDALNLFHTAHMELLDELAKLSDADLLKPFSRFQPNEPGNDQDAPILGWIIGNTYGHYAEHGEWIRAMLK